MTATAPVKGSLRVVDGPKGELKFHFNPAEITVTKSADWKSTPQKGAKKAPKTEFTGTNPQELKLQLTLEGLTRENQDVSEDVALLFSWTNPTEESLKKNKPQPPTLMLSWGPQKWFTAYLKSTSVKYTYFAADGTPLRATADLTLTETPEEAAKQNPTSGSLQSRTRRVMVAGDSLQSVAFREYGDPGLWRAVARLNDIDDPLRVSPGTVLFLPSLAEAEEAR